MRVLILLFFILPITALANEGGAIYFINKTGEEVWVEKRSLMNVSGHPYLLEKSEAIQFLVLPLSQPVVLNMGIKPSNGAWGSADGIPYLLIPGDTVVIEKGSGRYAQLLHPRNPAIQKAYQLVYRLAVERGSTDFSGVMQWARKEKLPNAGGRAENLQPADRDRIGEAFYRPLINQFAVEGDAVIALYRKHWQSALISFKLFLPLVDEAGLQVYRRFYADSLSSWQSFFSCDDCTGLPMYRAAAVQTAQLFFGHGVSFFQGAGNYFSGLTRDAVLARFMKQWLDEAPPAAIDLLPRYRSIASESPYRKVVDEQAAVTKRMLNTLTDSLWLVDGEGRMLQFEQLLDELKGQVIYLDFWASWCRPCLVQMPRSEKLQQELKGQKIAFVYLSLDEEEGSWRSEVSRLRLDMRSSYRILNGRTSSLLQQWNVRSIPRYIVIGRDGRIVNGDAPRPSEKTTANYLSGLAKE